MEILQATPPMYSDVPQLFPAIAYNIGIGVVTGATLAAIEVLGRLRIDRGPYVTGDLRAISYAITRAVAPLFIIGGGVFGGAVGGVGTVVNHIARRIF